MKNKISSAPGATPLTKTNKKSPVVFGCLIVAAMTAWTMGSGFSHAPAKARQGKAPILAVSYPWTFEAGTPASRRTVRTASEEVLRKVGYQTIQTSVAQAAWNKGGYQSPEVGHKPTNATLEAFGKAVGAARVLYGSVSWNTRTVWSKGAPKRLSIATIDAFVFDVPKNSMVFRAMQVQGRSDEKPEGYKLAAAVLISPLVKVSVDGAPTLAEERAAQIAIGYAYHPWATTVSAPH
jgi:hypothetical protein